MQWASVSVADTSKGSTSKVTQTDEHLYLPYPCSDSTECTNYIVTLDAGEYGLETWGAQGGNDTSYPTTVFGGRGGYSKGTVRLRTRTTLYVYVGGSGTGQSGSNWGSTGGGGATDIRIRDGPWNDATSLKTRIIVAGGGGGRHGKNHEGVTGFLGNDGGGSTAPTFTAEGYTITGATQTSGGSSPYSQSYVAVGSFGFANPNQMSNTNSKGGYNGGARGSDGSANSGAGGGWWGGCTSWPDGSGGSGFVYTTTNSQCTAPMNYFLSSAKTYAGNTEFLSPYGGTEVGHRGNGFARIISYETYPSASASNNFFRAYNGCYSYFVDRKRKSLIPLISVFIFSFLIEDRFSFDILPNTKLE